jgi:V/A-type H+-transporting ATPase subunit A
VTTTAKRQDERANARIVAVYGNLVIAETSGRVVQNSIAYCQRADGVRLLSEVIRVRGRMADLQVFEETGGLRVGDPVELREEMLSVVLAPGLLGQIYDGLQNPLPELARQVGFFLQPGVYIHGISETQTWEFTPTVAVGDGVEAGDTLGTVPEGLFRHQVMTPFGWEGPWKVDKIAAAGSYSVKDEIAVLVGAEGQRRSVTM